MRLAISYLTFLLVPLFSLVNARAGQIYSTAREGSIISMVSSTSGDGRDLGVIDRPNSFGTAFAPDGSLYLTTIRGTESELSRVNPVTGQTVFVGTFPLNDGAFIQAIDFDRQGNLFAVTNRGEVFQLSKSNDSEFRTTDDTKTLEVRVSAETGVSNISDIAINSRGEIYGVSQGQLYALNLTPEKMLPPVSISVQSDDQNTVQTESVSPADIMGIMFDENDVLFATAHVENSPLFNLDPSGIAKAISTTNLSYPTGGDYQADVPGGFGPVSLIARSSNPGSGSRLNGIRSVPLSGGGGGGGGGSSGGGGGGGNLGFPPTSLLPPTDQVPTETEFPPITSTPEPSSLIVFGLGIASLGLYEFARRRRPEMHQAN